MAAARQKEIKESMAVVAITTLGRAVFPVVVDGWGTLLMDI
jgi:hypothetical protein